MWQAIDLSKWKETPYILGRSATGSEPYAINLPLGAIHIDEDTGKRKPCIASQIEQKENGVFVGVRYLSGGNGVGNADKFELYENLTAEFGL